MPFQFHSLKDQSREHSLCVSRTRYSPDDEAPVVTTETTDGNDLENMVHRLVKIPATRKQQQDSDTAKGGYVVNKLHSETLVQNYQHSSLSCSRKNLNLMPLTTHQYSSSMHPSLIQTMFFNAAASFSWSDQEDCVVGVLAWTA